MEDSYSVPQCFGEFGDRFYPSRKYIPGIQPRQRMAEETTKGKMKRDCQSAESKRGEFN